MKPFVLKAIQAFVLLSLLTSAGLTSIAQDEAGIDVQVNLQSGQYWRGLVFSKIPCLQPEVTFYRNNFSFNVWAIGALNGKYYEVDFTPSYSIGNFTVWACDYYCPEYGEENRFFDFSSDNSRHSAELALEYEAGKLPFNLLAGTFFYGDTREDNGKPYYSTYVQAGYPFSLWIFEAEAALGITPWEGYYAEKLALVHVGFSLAYEHELKSGASLPASLNIVANPSAKSLFATLSIGFWKSFSKSR